MQSAKTLMRKYKRFHENHVLFYNYVISVELCIALFLVFRVFLFAIDVWGAYISLDKVYSGNLTRSTSDVCRRPDLRITMIDECRSADQMVMRYQITHAFFHVKDTTYLCGSAPCMSLLLGEASLASLTLFIVSLVILIIVLALVLLYTKNMCRRIVDITSEKIVNHGQRRQMMHDRDASISAFSTPVIVNTDYGPLIEDVEDGHNVRRRKPASSEASFEL